MAQKHMVLLTKNSHLEKLHTVYMAQECLLDVKNSVNVHKGCMGVGTMHCI